MKEFKAEARRYADTDPYRAERVVQPRRQQHIWKYVVKITDQPDPMMSVILGDYLHNLRSALDHIAVALAPKDRKHNAQFPIRDRDPWAKKPDGTYVVASDDARKSFEQAIRGMPNAAQTVIIDLQPYWNAPDDIKLHPLSILSRLDNADKHKELVTLGSGIKDPHTFVTLRGANLPQRNVGFCHDGTEVAKFKVIRTVFPDFDESEVKVEIYGTAEVAARVAGVLGFFEIDGTVAAIIDTIRDRILTPLEVHLPHR